MNPKINYFKKYRYLLFAMLLIVFIWVASIPIRNNLSKQYVDQGDQLLLQRKFVSADLAYSKAQILSEKYKPESKIEIVKKAEVDLNALKDVYRLSGQTKELNEVIRAMSVPEDEVVAVKNARSYLEKGDFLLAISSAKTATEMDKTYRDAWVHLGISNLKGAVDPEISKEAQEVYKQNAKAAFLQAQSLDPSNTDIAKYLAML